MPEVMITKVMPTPSTAQTAMFCEISEKLLADRNFSPAAMENAATINTKTPENPHRLQFASRFRRIVGASHRLLTACGSATAGSSGRRGACHAASSAAGAGAEVQGAGHRTDQLLHRGALGRERRHPGAEPHHLDPVGDLEHVRHGMRDQHHRDPLVPDPFDGVQHVLGLHHAQRRGGLIQEDDLVRPADRPDDGDLLPLTARHRPDLRGERTHRATQLPNPASALARIFFSSMKPNPPSTPFAGISRPRNMFCTGFRCGASARS